MTVGKFQMETSAKWRERERERVQVRERRGGGQRREKENKEKNEIVKWKSLSHVRVFATPWNSPGQNTGVDSLSLLQGIFPTQGMNSGLPHCRQILYQLSHKGSPSILEWVAYPFSSRSSPPRNRTRVSCIAGRFFTSRAIKKALICLMLQFVLFGFVYLCWLGHFKDP